MGVPPRMLQYVVANVADAGCVEPAKPLQGAATGMNELAEPPRVGKTTR
jgi:hypothetical protein